MKKIVIFGAGNLGTVLAAELSHDNEVLGFLDNNNEWEIYIPEFNSIFKDKK